MIDYHTFHQIRQLWDVEQLSAAQIARRLNLHPQTVYQWRDRPKYQRRAAAVKRKSKLDAFKATVVRLLAQHPYTAQQLFQRLQASGYTGGYSILKHYVRQVRPTAEPAFLTLQFAPGQTAQVDWGSDGWLREGTTRRPVHPEVVGDFAGLPAA